MNRTLVKSPPELWSELSEVEYLERHLGEFGEISITRLEPEHTVAWEGESARGTVELEAAGWGTKVTLSAALPEPMEAVADADADADADPEAVAVAVAEAEAEAEAVTDADAPPRRSWLQRFFWRRRAADLDLSEAELATLEFEAVEPEPLAWYDPDDPADDLEAVEPVPEPDADADAVTIDTQRARVVFEEILDALGAAHHRPFSRG